MKSKVYVWDIRRTCLTFQNGRPSKQRKHMNQYRVHGGKRD